MLVATLRPDGVVQAGPYAVVGAASVAAALADESDASYIDASAFGTSYAEVSLPTWTKGTYTLTSISARVTNNGSPAVLTPRVDIVTGSTVLAVGALSTYGTPIPPPTTYVGDLTQTQIDDLRIRLTLPNDLDEHSATALYVDVNADPPPPLPVNLTTIDRVTTEDAAPLVAPHRISRDTAHDDAEVRFTSSSGGQLVPSADLIPFVGPLPAIGLRLAFRPGATKRPGNYWGPYPDTALYPDRDTTLPLSPRSFLPNVADLPDLALYPSAAGATPRQRDILAWTIRSGGVGASTGKLVKRASHKRSSPAMPASPTATCGRGDPSRVPSGTQRIVPFLFADVDDGGADGARTINVYALTANQGWS